MNAETRMLNRHKKNEFRDALRKQQTRQGEFEKSFLHLDHPLVGGSQILEASDRGKGAAEIRDAAAETPRWRILWDRARGKLTRKQKRILDALLADFRTTAAAKMAGASTAAVKQFKKTFFKLHFAQCHTAWKRDFAD